MEFHTDVRSIRLDEVEHLIDRERRGSEQLGPDVHAAPVELIRDLSDLAVEDEHEKQSEDPTFGGLDAVIGGGTEERGAFDHQHDRVVGVRVAVCEPRPAGGVQVGKHLGRVNGRPCFVERVDDEDTHRIGTRLDAEIVGKH